MDVLRELEAVYEDPLFADVKPTEPKLTSGDRLVQSFEEIIAFYETHQRLPDETKGRNEKLLFNRLQGIICDSEKTSRLLPLDKYEFLRPKQSVSADAIQDLFDDPLLDMPADASDLLNVPEHLKKKLTKDAAEYIAQRRKCEDFHLYKDGFARVHEELKSGKRSFVKFTSSQLKSPGSYFVLDGVLLLLADVVETDRTRKGHFTGRSICIFENGTKTDLKLDTLRRALYESGYAIRENQNTTSAFFEHRFSANQQDKPTGYIYVLKSLSELPEIKAIDHLYKIGYSTTTVEERIANAEHEPTYLNAKVEIVAVWKTYNMHVALFESLIHKLFHDVKLNVHVGHITPEEWFVVPYSAIEKAIHCIINETPISYDPVNQLIIEHTVAESTSKETIDTKGWKILTLIIKATYFQQIIAGTKKQEYRQVKPSTINKYTYWEDGKRWLKPYDAIRFYVGYHPNRPTALIKVTDTHYNPKQQLVTYSLGEIIEVSEGE
jgi:hypothetical protein